MKHLSALILALCLPQLVPAVTIYDEIPVSVIKVTASSTFSPEQTAQHLIDGSGLTGDRQMAMKVSMKLAPGSVGGTAGDLLEKDSSGRQLLKFTVNGPMANPKVKFDFQDLGKAAVQRAGQELLKNPDVQNAVNDLQNTLKGIFH